MVTAGGCYISMRFSDVIKSSAKPPPPPPRPPRPPPPANVNLIQFNSIKLA